MNLHDNSKGAPDKSEKYKVPDCQRTGKCAAKTRPLFNENESWTANGLKIAGRFDKICREFIVEYSEHKYRELETIMMTSVYSNILEAVIKRRLT